MSAKGRAEKLSQRTPCFRRRHRLPRFSLFPLLQNLQRFHCPPKAEQITSVIPAKNEMVRDLVAQKKLLFALTFVDFFASL
jgi:hypothetical protein